MFSLVIISVVYLAISNIVHHNWLNIHGNKGSFVVKKKYIERGFFLLNDSYYIKLTVPKSIGRRDIEQQIPLSQWMRLKKGDSYKLLYDPTDITRYKLLDSSNQSNYIALLFLLVYVLLFVFFTLQAVKGYRERKHNSYIGEKFRFLAAFLFSMSALLLFYSNYKSNIFYYGFSSNLYNGKFLALLVLAIILLVSTLMCFIRFLSAWRGLKLKLDLISKGRQFKGVVKEVHFNKNDVFKKLQYEFFVDKKRYTKIISRMLLHKQIDSINPGEEVTIYYEKNNPNNNVWVYE